MADFQARINFRKEKNICSRIISKLPCFKEGQQEHISGAGLRNLGDKTKRLGGTTMAKNKLNLGAFKAKLAVEVKAKVK
jgi:hypothetical protein